MSHHVHSQHGSGVVNLVVSRKPGKRKRGSCCDRRSDRARVLEANTHSRCHRGREQPCLLQRNVNRWAIQQLNACLQQQETPMAILTSERESFPRQVQSLSATTGTPGQRVRAGVVDIRAIGKPDQFDGDPMKYADWSFKLRSYFRAVDQRYQHELTTTEASPTPRLNATMKGSAYTDVLHFGDDNCRSRVGQVPQRRRERRVRGLEAVRDGMGTQASDEVCGDS